MREEVERLKRTVDDFARFARLPRPVPVRLDLSAWVKQALPLFAGPGGPELETDLATGVEVSADRDQLAQVLHNLLRNAAEAVPDAPWVAVRVQGDGGWAVLEVEDAGPGVAADQRERIFEPSFSSKPGGSGLGLAIARRIATDHGGTLEVVGGSRGGALFRLRLPLGGKP
jgi:two-component system, NtrC family, nitrogen regulation sensor histidine kinase NtrY